MNIFEIQKELVDIFNELEENGGELTDELADKLNVTQDNFKTKVKSYVDAMKSLDSDMNCIDTEIKRLQTLKKSKKSTYERLERICIAAVEAFGDVTSKGIKYFDYGTGKIQIRNSEKVNVNDELCDIVASELNRAFAFEAMLGDASVREGFTIEDITERVKAHGIDITANDLNNLNLSIKFNDVVSDLLSGDLYKSMVKLIHDYPIMKIEPSIDKTMIKKELKDGNNLTFANIIPNQMLTIK